MGIAIARRPSRRGSAVVLALALVASLLVLGPPAEAAGRAGTAADALRWSPCYRDVGPDFECALVPVPLDHDRPNGPTIQLFLIRLPAADPEARIGSLFFNPGGPGGSGVDFLLQNGQDADLVLGAEIRERFDLVGLDPRGVGRSSIVRCFGNVGQYLQAMPPVFFPVTAEEEAAFQASDTLLADRCGQRGNRVGSHMSTATTARDLDLLRQRVGDDGLSYLGLSYGSYLGVVYANLFPERVRAIVIDGVLDPEAWRNRAGETPSTMAIRSHIGAQETLERFFALCDGTAGQCALAPDAEDRFAALTDRLLEEPVVAIDPVTGDPFPLGYADVVGLTLSLLYNPFTLPLLVDFLAAVEGGDAALIGAVVAALSEFSPFANRRGYPVYPSAEAFEAVTCTDSSNPADYAVWSAAAAEADEESYFGRAWTWMGSACAQWPFSDADRYDGSFDAETAQPVLVASTLYDPATPLSGAEAVRALLPNSALLRADVPAHTTLGSSVCAGAITGQYLLAPEATAANVDGFTCPQEFDPFALAGPIGPNGELTPDLRERLTRWATLR